MKLLFSIILIALLSLVAGLYLPFWSVALVAFLVAILIPQTPGFSFLSGFLALFLLWGCMALVLDSSNNHIMGARMSQLIFKVPNALLVVTLTAFIGGLLAGMGSLCASFIHQGAKPKEEQA